MYGGGWGQIWRRSAGWRRPATNPAPPGRLAAVGTVVAHGGAANRAGPSRCVLNFAAVIDTALPLSSSSCRRRYVSLRCRPWRPAAEARSPRPAARRRPPAPVPAPVPAAPRSSAAAWRRPARPRATFRRRRASTPRAAWLGGVTVTEYWPAPESWFVGRMVKAPGLPGLHRIDWLYSATGMSMEGDGIGLDGRPYHIDALGDGGWVTAGGASTSPSSGWSAGAPYWRAGGYWRNRARAVTFPLSTGGWSDGRGARYVPLPRRLVRRRRLAAAAATTSRSRSIPASSRSAAASTCPRIATTDTAAGSSPATPAAPSSAITSMSTVRRRPARWTPVSYLTAQRIFVIKPKR